LIGISEFVDNEQLANFESILVQVGVRECCTIADEKNFLVAKLAELLRRCEIPIIAKKRSEFRTSDVEQDAKRLVGERKWRQVSLDRCVACWVFFFFFFFF
jgi:DNA mismatch repair protein MSH2